MTQLRIILTVNYSPWAPYAGGGQRSTHQLAVALAGLGHDVSAIYTRAPLDTWRPPPDLPYRALTAPFVALKSQGKSPLRPLNAVTLRRKLAALAPRGAVVHCQGEEGALLPELAERQRFALIATPRYPAYPERLLSGGLLTRHLVPPKFWALEALLTRADRVAATSEDSAQLVARAFSIAPERLSVVPNGIAEEFCSVTRSAQAGAGPIVFFGRIEHSKGIDLLLAAYAELPPPRPPLVIVGRGSAEAEMKKRAAAIDPAIDFLGWREPPALAQLLASARLAVLPSREESFGNAMAEAMATGTPLLTTNVGSIPEVTAGAAHLVDPADPRALHQALRHLLTSREAAAELGARGRERILQNYSWSASAQRYEALYREALRERGL